MSKRFVDFKGYPRVCSGCDTPFLGNAPNAKLCGGCRTDGVPKLCVTCHAPFLSKYSGKYCGECFSKKAYLVGVPRSREVVEKVKAGTINWSTSDEGKRFHKKNGNANSAKLKKYFKTAKGKSQIKNSAKKQSRAMRKKILNGQFTPNITNSFTHWDAVVEYKGKTKRFRSSWEACVWLSNPTLEYETIRVPLPTGGCVITDFVDNTNKTVYEIKPTAFWQKQQNKIDAIIDFCLKNEYKFVWINEKNILQFIDVTVFSSDINKKQLEKVLNATKKNTD